MPIWRNGQRLDRPIAWNCLFRVSPFPCPLFSRIQELEGYCDGVADAKQVDGEKGSVETGDMRVMIGFGI